MNQSDDTVFQKVLRIETKVGNHLLFVSTRSSYAVSLL